MEGELDKILDELVNNLPIKATEIGWEVIGETVQDTKTALLNWRDRETKKAYDKKFREWHDENYKLRLRIQELDGLCLTKSCSNEIEGDSSYCPNCNRLWET